MLCKNAEWLTIPFWFNTRLMLKYIIAVKLVLEIVSKFTTYSSKQECIALNFAFRASMSALNAAYSAL